MIEPWNPSLAGLSGPIYLRIADSIAHAVRSGQLAVGSRLPTQRELAERLAVTVGTVMRGYAEAERRGLIAGEVGRGTYVSARDGGGRAAQDDGTRRQDSYGRGAHERAAEYRPRFDSAGAAANAADTVGSERAIASPSEPPTPQLVDLGINYPPPAEGQSIQSLLSSTLSQLACSHDIARLLDYQPHIGMEPHRLAGVEWLRRYGLETSADRVVICAGADHAIETALAAVTKPGDTLLTDQLTYPGIGAIAARLHVSLRGVELDRDGLLPDAMERAIRKTGAKVLYCQPTLHNPTTYVMPEARRKEIAQIATHHGLTLVEDDLYGLLEAERPAPLSTFAPEHSYFIAGTSKVVAPGLRIAYLATPPRRAEAVAGAAWTAAWVASPLTAQVMSDWIVDGTADAIVEGRRRETLARGQLARAALAELVDLPHSQSYHLWLPLAPPLTAHGVTLRAREEGVAVTPADRFFVGEVGAAPAAVRMSVGTPLSRAHLSVGLDRLKRALSTERGVLGRLAPLL